MNIFSAFDTGVMVALLLGIEFLRSDIRTILYCKRNDPMILKSCLYTLLILLTSLYSIVVGAMLHPEPVPIYELIPGFQIGVYGFSFSFILLAVACLYRKILPFVLWGYAIIYVIGVLVPLLRYIVAMMDYFARTRVELVKLLIVFCGLPPPILFLRSRSGFLLGKGSSIPQMGSYSQVSLLYEK